MVNGIGSNFSGTQALRALNAFQMDEKTVRQGQKQLEDPTQEQSAIKEEPSIALRNDISAHKANEIKKYGQMFDINISNADINYALSYGRSVIVDYKA